MTNDTTTNESIALVTGANKGIGYEVTAQLARLGWTVLLGARNRHRRDHATQTLRAEGLDVHPVALDVTDAATIEAAAKEIDDRYGRLDALVNNAGIAGARTWQTPRTADLQEVRRVFETNVFGVIAVTNAMLPLLLRSSRPRVVNVSSGLGSLAQMTDPEHYMSALPAFVAYPPSKSAANAVTVQYAKDLRESGVLVNAVAPGACATELTAESYRHPRTAAQGAAIAVRMATLGVGGPTGGFFDDDGSVAW